ncbi:uncharacterized protein DDB_G0280579-like [Saccostrea cucullata]|uniref:uncharacterized protein DDB_G0280579-like n=1 Tax=Saccostrea cuccullata TaxID=36930 RepID=UPI002ED636D7
MAANSNNQEALGTNTVSFTADDGKNVLLQLDDKTLENLQNNDPNTIEFVLNLVAEQEQEESEENEIEDPKPSGEAITPTNSWTKERSKVLLHEYRERYLQFNSPTQKKKTLWREICQVINTETKSTFTSQQVEGRFKTMLSSYRKYKDAKKRTGTERKEYEFASEMDDIFGNSHSTTPAFVVESSSTSTSTATTHRSRAKEPSPSTSSSSESVTNTESESSKDNEKQINEGKAGRRKRKHHPTTGASQLIDFLKCYTEKREEEDRKKEEEEKRRTETMHKEHMKMLSGLTNIIGKLADVAAAAKK